MLIPVQWLQDFVDVPADADSLAARLTGAGNEIEEVRHSEIGPVLDLKLTPNRGDMLGMRGAAREVAALYELPLRDVEYSLPPGPPEAAEGRVRIDAPDLCPRYTARIIRGITVGPSPQWLRQRLEAAGLRSINNVVDVTNYVMLEQNQPLHAFDLSRLGGERIIVRCASEGERITTLDGTDVALDPEMLVIADESVPVAIAGVMGGRDSEVTGATRDVLLESAAFAAASVRRTARRCGLATAAAYRFERGVDPNGVLRAADRAARLLAELTGGVVSETVYDVYPHPLEPRVIPFRPGRCRDLLGLELDDEMILRLLERQELGVEAGLPPWRVTAPTYRPDLAIEEDLIEEVGRLYGYEKLPETLPGEVAAAGALSAQEAMLRDVRETLIGLGLYDVVTNTLTSSALLERARLESSTAWPHGRPVRLRNPLSEEFDTLRPSLLPGLLEAARHNLNRGARDLFFFEAGQAHSLAGESAPQERLLVAGLLLGSRWAETWNTDRKLDADFYAARGTVEALATALGAGPLRAEPADVPALHPGRSALLFANDLLLGAVGELHPEVAAALEMPPGVYLFELDGDALLRLTESERRYRPPSRFPVALRDVAVLVPRTTPAGSVEQVLREVFGEWARRVRLFDVYEGPPLPPDRLSLAYALELGSDDRTLTDAEVDGRLATARERLRCELDAHFRE